ncbi:MAG: single-stranded DNA-binding protein [Actinomycetota bacterium]|nr:single-stranded DNA-binding protein [Actinomycetota bacterium]
MSQGGYVTLVGFVAQDPRQHDTKGGLVTKLRIGATTRVQDRVTQEWRDADTAYYDVSCWRRLGDHVRASMRKGDPVFVKGRFRARSYEDKTGQLRKVIDIQADAVGHDLNRGVANYIRPQHQPVTSDGNPVRDPDEEGQGSAELAGGAGGMIDEEAIERFGRDLDESLNEAGFAGPALDEDEETDVAAPL